MKNYYIIFFKLWSNLKSTIALRREVTSPITIQCDPVISSNFHSIQFNDASYIWLQRTLHWTGERRSMKHLKNVWTRNKDMKMLLENRVCTPKLLKMNYSTSRALKVLGTLKKVNLSFLFFYLRISHRSRITKNNLFISYVFVFRLF